ncbi:MFS transporter [Acidianus ambivalens]|uniref:MFS transporter n=1 Tax=Acidianus ambivalens TaxID=2283 RepID=A0A650CWI8_ACIAM|nr:MFS transporter [Acidianus ambivalens]MQL54399.1 MFS transporter [Acidianus ambivalens]QGR22221.1 MFS transporter [Acidianus ambivalens]
MKSATVFASMIGTIIEWYDVFIFGTGAYYISVELFPPTNPTVALLNTFLVFALGFLTRPLGAIVFGHFGDKIGRKEMLIITLTSSGIASGLVGVLPTYAQVGLLTVFLLVILRLILGFGLGGEWGGAVLLMVENTENKRGFWVSFVQSTVGIALILGSLVFLILSSFTSSSFMLSVGWRIPFLLSFILTIIGLLIRLRVEETKAFEKAKEENKILETPSKELFKRNWKEVLLGTLLAGSLGTIFYVGAILVPAVMESLKILPLQLGFLATLLMGLMDSIFVFVGGILSDKLGRKILLLISNVLGLILLYPSFYIPNDLVIVALIATYGIAHGLGYSPLAALISEIFPTNVRYSGSSSAYQFGNSFIGGPASYVSDFLGSVSYALYPIFAVIIILISIASLYKIKETKEVKIT